MTDADAIKVGLAVLAFVVGVAGFVVWVVRLLLGKLDKSIGVLFDAVNDHGRRIGVLETTVVSMDPDQTHILRPRR